MKTHLTDTACAKAKSNGDKVNKLGDGGGLYLYVFPAAKVFYFRYKHPKTLRDSVMALKEYPAEMTLADARQERDRLRGLLAKDIDPQEARDEKRKEVQLNADRTFLSLSEAWFEAECLKADPPLSLRTIEKNRFLLNRLQADLGKFLVTDLRTQHIFDMVEIVTSEISADYADRQVRSASRILCWCIARSVVQFDVAAPVATHLATKKKRAEDRKQHRPALTRTGTHTQQVAKVSELWRDIDGYHGPVVRLALKFLMLTMARPGEVQNAEWEHIDLDEKVWVIPEDKMKMRKEHHVPLSAQAVAILREVKTLVGGKRWVFSRTGAVRKLRFGTIEQGLSESALNKALRTLGYDTKKEQTGHGFRTIASTLLNEEVNEDDTQRWSKDAIELQLAHVDSSTRGDYNEAQLWKTRTKMLQHWADTLDGFLGGGNVVKIRRAA